MRVQCVLCDSVEDIDNDSLQAKQLRNRRATMYMCSSCRDRIEKRTKERIATGNFRLYKQKKNEDPFI